PIWLPAHRRLVRQRRRRCDPRRHHHRKRHRRRHATIRSDRPRRNHGRTRPRRARRNLRRNPVACAAALAAIEVMEQADLKTRAQEIEAIIRDEFAQLSAFPEVAEIRGRGAMMAIELIDATGRPNAALTAAVAARAKAEGVLLLTCGTDGNVIRLLPPLVIA